MKRFSLGDKGEADGINMASAVLMLISHGSHGVGEYSSAAAVAAAAEGGRVFECKTCNRQFPSFQALGGHRASHKKLRLADGGQGRGPVGNKPKVHECSVCGVEFKIGQALGGHMRRHRGGAHGHADDAAGLKSDGKKVGGFDLNLPPSDENLDPRKLGFVLDLGLRLGLEYVR